jgi:hypothetical protein
MIEMRPGMTRMPECDMLVVKSVMAGLVPAIHVLSLERMKDVDARDKPGHDERGTE